jgi:hypothetical protein
MELRQLRHLVAAAKEPGSGPGRRAAAEMYVYYASA